MAKEKAPYVLTPRRLAACRANLRKAQAANRRNFRVTPGRLAAMLANLRKAQEACRQNYRYTPARDAANRANLQKAQATPRSPESYARSRFNDLKHGLYAQTFEETMALLREDPKEFEGLRRRLDRTFAPRDEPERKLLRRLAEALWRRLRLFRAQARWETDALQAFLGSCPPAKALSPDLARRRAFGLMSILLDQDRLAERSDWLLRRIEHMLRFLLRKRLGHEDPEFKGIVLERCRGLKELEALENEQATERALARLLAGGPEVEKIIEQSMPAWWLRKYRRQEADGRRQQERPPSGAARHPLPKEGAKTLGNVPPLPQSS